MAWTVYVTLQQRGTKEETTEWAQFETRADADGASQKLQTDISNAAPNDFITLSSPRETISFLTQDFRRVVVREFRPSGQVRRVT